MKKLLLLLALLAILGAPIADATLALPPKDAEIFMPMKADIK